MLEDILDSPKLRDDVSADVFRFYIRLLAMLNRTKSRDGKINLGRRAINLCAGREQLRHSLAVARGGAVAGLYTLSVDGEQALITVPNWAKHQGFTPARLRSDSGETPPPNPNPNPNPTTAPKRAEARQPPTLDGFVRMLKGEIPTGLGGETWPSPAAWFEEHREILIGEAQKQTGEESGTKFNGAFRSTLMRYWKNKHPKGRSNGSGPKPGTLDAALADQLERIDREERQNAARDEATSQLSLSSGRES